MPMLSISFQNSFQNLNLIIEVLKSLRNKEAGGERGIPRSLSQVINYFQYLVFSTTYHFSKVVSVRLEQSVSDILISKPISKWNSFFQHLRLLDLLELKKGRLL